MKLFPFFHHRDPIEMLVVVLGGLVVVVFAFFMARGDLDAYMGLLVRGVPFLEKETVAVPDHFAVGVMEPLREESQDMENGVEEAQTAIVTPSPSVHIVASKEETDVTPQQPPKVEKSSSPSPQPSPRVSPKSGKFFVQVGAFSKEANAQNMVNTLQGLGYSAVVEQVSSLYRVRIYGFSSQEEAQKVVNRLKAQGIECFMGR